MAKFLWVSIVCMSFISALKAQPILLAEEEHSSRNERLYNFSQPVQLRRWEIAADTIDEWKQWELADNYSFGINRGTMSMITDLESLHPYFRDKVIELMRICRSKGIELAIVETYRTHAKQTEYKTMGRKYTRTKAGQSKHQYGLAVDIVPMIDSVPQWRNIKLWRRIGPMGERLGLRWGGRWHKLFDPGHFEWTGGLLTRDLAQGKLPVIPKPDQYPCLAEDVRELKRHWKSWETEQSSIARATVKERIHPSSPPRVALRVGED